MHLTQNPSVVVCCALTAFHALQWTGDTIKRFRQCPDPAVGEPIAPAFLKHVDDQTAAGLAAVYRAIHQHGLLGIDFTRWGVIAAPRFLGRTTVAQALKRFALEGAWGVSPHLIPHCSLHAVSGTISQALKIHGPNFGVGGGPDSAAKAMLAAAAMLENDSLPGIWVVLTGWNHELESGVRSRQELRAKSQEPNNAADSPCSALARPPDGSGEATYALPLCSAVALALVADGPAVSGPRLRLTAETFGEEGTAVGEPAAAIPRLTLEALRDALASGEVPARTLWRLECGGSVELTARHWKRS